MFRSEQLYLRAKELLKHDMDFFSAHNAVTVIGYGRSPFGQSVCSRPTVITRRIGGENELVPASLHVVIHVSFV